MRKLLLATAAAVLLSTPTLAADLAPAPVEPAAPVYLPFTWTGFYVGANVGVGFGDSDRDVSFVPDPRGNRPPSDPSLGDDDVGLTAGVQAGFNYQMGMLVVGVEADINYLNLDSSSEVTTLDVGAGTTEVIRTSQEINWFGTLRARLGVTPMDRLLIYATGGLAGADIDDEASVSFDDGVSVTSFDGSDSGTNWGWTIGGGLEYAITDNWTVKAEYLFVDLDDSDYDVTTPGSADFYQVEGDNQFSVVRLGVNYKF
jgi:outer membrane immunogenic protein